MPTASLSINVTAFQDLLSANPSLPRVCSVDNPVLTADPSINDKVSVVGDVIKTTGNAQINLEFTILPANTYTPIGIAFVQTANPVGSADPGGSTNFDPANLSAKSNSKISVNNKRTNTGGATWKFYIFIQRNSDRLLGLIDPSIENDN